MTGLAFLVDRLQRQLAGDEEFLELASGALREEIDWREQARDALQQISDDVFFSNTKRLRVPEVQPDAFPLHIEPGRFTIVLNHYSRSTFDRLLLAGRITPHYHHFSFCTRILRGKFCHIEYQNQGTIESPNLIKRTQKWFTEGNVFDVKYPDYHCIVAPEDNTISLMIRGRALFTNPHIGDGSFDLQQAMQARRGLLSILSPEELKIQS
jgi:hypothetical protein